ncbi:propeptide, peptidase M4/M36 [Formosa agariphila KMM 3901]|uniref:Propeptide, peptidase M4/M36 n=1 Tax=Formosa agariphila (strain DSM 15362 / KCTC 12365 / LMG 23005 / KMM 3901 / M-2Alg 35-1) TaxID=1347342 RepID=T2KSD9_FORAG|nr:T9SS type A sorting domain-containing protein [Formosa agariphila]CDF81249.1 propeptide, peptidase M4/M36 [Formosa agariphila KMM 3901]
MIHRILPLFCVVICSFQITYSQNQNEAVASAWLNSNFSELQSQKAYELRSEFNQVGASGETFRYSQFVNDVPVYDAGVAVHVSPNSEVTYHSGSFYSSISRINTTPNMSADQAVSIAAKALGIEGTITQKESKLYVYNDDGATLLVYRVTTNSRTLNGFWETIINAKTGDIISNKDIAHYHHGHDDGHEDLLNSTIPTHIEAKGKIFNPDPLSVTNEVYGGHFMDNNDETNDYLDRARTDVSFQILNSSDGVYRLKGDYLEIKDIQDPVTGLFEQDSPEFSFTRDQDGFEAVNAYYHIDQNMRYINETLGIPLKSMFNDGIIYYDPHAFNGSDNSSYGGGILKFGIGGVDDAEDADVIVHELGHGIHEWLIQSSISQVEGLSEGFGDYWAQSYSRGLERYNSSRSSTTYNDLFKWDGHNEFWGGRITNYEQTYPEGLTGKIHKDGQIFASTLIQVWEYLGKEKTDLIVLEGMAMTSSKTNQLEAITAIRQAAVDMNLGCESITAITNIFTERGYAVEAYQCSTLSVDENEITNISIYPNPANDVISFKNINNTHQITIYNMMGQQVLKHSIDRANNSVNVSNLSKGMYVVSFKDSATNFKFIKQ